MMREAVRCVRRLGAGVAALTGISYLCGCSPTPLATNDGGGTRVGNPVVMGKIAGAGGVSVRSVRVMLIPEGFNPITDTLKGNVSTDTTDSSGSFSLTTPDAGRYNLEARGILDGARLLRFNVIAIRDSTVVLPVDTMRMPGFIKIAVSGENNWTDGYVYVPGTTIAAWHGDRDTVTLDSVPVSTIPALYYSQRSDTWRKVIRYDIPVRSNDTTLIRYPEWSFSRKIILNTSASGAPIPSDVHDFPVLIRLDSGTIDFSQAKTGGEDVRFTKSDNTPLPYEIELWDRAARKAAIWVKVDTVRADDSVQSIIMYWGNPSAADSSKSAAVFDTGSGFQGVWHLGGQGNESATDATANRYHGIASGMSGSAAIAGAIGNGRAFDGASSYITMPSTASGRLNFPENGTFTVSAWVYADPLDTTYRTIVSKGHQEYFLQLTSSLVKKPSWEFSNFSPTEHWRMSTSAAEENKWTLLTGVISDTVQSLYCDGTLVASVTATYTHPVKLARDTSDQFTIGRFFTEPTYPARFGYCHFKGKIDEVVVSSHARDAGWILLCYLNQGSEDKLVRFK